MIAEKAEKCRSEGNKHFCAKRYWNAVKCYTDSLKFSVTALTLSNRAQAFLNLKKNEEALMDSRLATELDPTAIKGFYRYSVALSNLGLYKEAEDKLKIAMDLKQNEELERLLKSVTGKQNVKELRIIPVNKCLTIRSKEPLVELEVEIDDRKMTTEDFDQKVNQILKENNDLLNPVKDFKLPPVPSTSYQFLADYESLATDSISFCKYFLTINVDSYNKLMDDVLDPDMIINLIDGCNKLFSTETTDFTATQAANALIALGGIRGFSLALMFLQEENKAALRSFLEKNSVDLLTTAVVMQIYDL